MSQILSYIQYIFSYTTNDASIELKVKRAPVPNRHRLHLG
jgi:hypothetical protein